MTYTQELEKALVSCQQDLDEQRARDERLQFDHMLEEGKKWQLVVDAARKYLAELT